MAATAQLDVKLIGTDRLSSVMRGASGAVDQFGASVSKSGGILGNVAGVAAGVAAAGVAALAAGIAATGVALASSIKTAASFEQQMADIKAVSGATGAEFESLRQLAMNLGADTRFSASQAAAGIEELVKGGISIKDILGGAAAGALNLAAAGGVSLAEAANIAAIAINAFNLKGSQVPQVADLIAGAANASTISVGDFRQSLAQAAASAAMSGVSFKDTATAIALLGKQGIVGSDAGTSLKQFFNTLTPATKTAREAMKKLGIITEDGKNQFFDAAGNMKDLATISGILQKATAKLSVEQRNQALETIFGSDAIRAASVLATAGAGGFKDLADAIARIKAADVAKERMNTLEGAIEELNGAWEKLQIMVGTAFIPIIRRAVEGTTDFVRRIIEFEKATGTFQTAADAVATFIGALQGNWAGDAASGIHPLVLALGQLGQFIREQVLPAFNQFVAFVRAAFSGDLNATVERFLDLIAGQQTRLVAALTMWGQAFINWVAPMLPMLLAKLQEMVGQIGAWIALQTPIFLENFLVHWLPAFVDWLADAGTAALPHLTAFLNSVVAWVDTNAAPLLEAFIAHWTPKLTEWIAISAKQIVPRLLQFQAELVKWVATEGVPAMIQIGLDLGGAIVFGIIQALQSVTEKIRAALIQAGIPLPGQPGGVGTVPPGVTQRPPAALTPEQQQAVNNFVMKLDQGSAAMDKIIRVSNAHVDTANQILMSWLPQT